MGKYWWVTWIKVLALTAVFAVVIVLGYRQVKKSVADYLVDAPADAKLTDKLNLEDMVFDYAGEFCLPHDGGIRAIAMPSPSRWPDIDLARSYKTTCTGGAIALPVFLTVKEPAQPKITEGRIV